MTELQKIKRAISFLMWYVPVFFIGYKTHWSVGLGLFFMAISHNIEKHS